MAITIYTCVLAHASWMVIGISNEEQAVEEAPHSRSQVLNVESASVRKHLEACLPQQVKLTWETPVVTLDGTREVIQQGGNGNKRKWPRRRAKRCDFIATLSSGHRVGQISAKIFSTERRLFTFTAWLWAANRSLCRGVCILLYCTYIMIS